MATNEKSNPLMAVVAIGRDQPLADTEKAVSDGEAFDVEGREEVELDDFSISRFRKMFELLDRWDRQ